jgi:hypothetical protein
VKIAVKKRSARRNEHGGEEEAAQQKLKRRETQIRSAVVGISAEENQNCFGQ